jgi:hypothetical protein
MGHAVKTIRNAADKNFAAPNAAIIAVASTVKADA